MTALMFAVCAASLLGMVGLATEVGTWYLAQTQAHSIADAVAVAGALQGSWTSAADYDPSGLLPTPLSGYAGASIQANTVAWPNVTSPATRATVTIPMPSFLALLFTNRSVTVGASATAVVSPTGNVACALSLSGPLTITQSQTALWAGFPCFLASNFDGSQAIDVSPPLLNAQGLTTVGTCSDTCPAADPVSPLVGGLNADKNIILARPTATLQPPTTNPYTVVDAGVSVQASQIICPDPASGTITYPPGTVPNPITHCPSSPTNATITALVPADGDGFVGPNVNPALSCVPASGLVCGYYNIKATITSDVATYPGTYLFVNSSLTIQRGSVQCLAYSGGNVGPCDPNVSAGYYPLGQVGVAFVFAGGSPGDLIICGSAAWGPCPRGTGASVTLSSQALNGFSPALNGVLFYRSSTSPNPDGSTDAPVVYIDDSGNTLLEGGMYFPNAYVSFTANTGTGSTFIANPNGFPLSCAIIVAGVLTLGYPPGASAQPAATTQFSEGGCVATAFNTPMPLVQTVQLVQ